MGVRLNTENISILRLRIDTGEPLFSSPSSVNRPADWPVAQNDPNTQRLGPNALLQQGTVANSFPNVTNRLNAATTPGPATDEVGATAPSVDPSTANADAENVQEFDLNAPPKIQDFQFLMAPETTRDLELQVQQRRLEHRLDTVDSRLRLADSLMVQIDTRLERARLQQDLDTVARQIWRLRLEHVFSNGSANPEDVESTSQTSQSVKDAFQESQSSQTSRTPALNLLA